MGRKASSRNASRKPLAAFLFPPKFVKACFAESDLERLRERCEVRDEKREVIKSADIAGLGADAEIWVTGWGTPPLPPEAFERAPRLRHVAHSAGSTRRLLPEEFWKRGISLSTANGALAIGVAEYILGLLIVSSKRVWQWREEARRKAWRSEAEIARMKELYGTTLGILSASRVGRHLITLTEPFSVKRLLYDPFVTAAEARKLGVEKAESVLEVAKGCDYLVICTPSLPETRHLVSREVLRALPDDCILINCARGAIIDETALVEELQKGRFFACLDVTDPEPPKPESPLWTLPNVVLTPHIAGHSWNARQRQGNYTVSAILDVLDGRPGGWCITEKQWRIMG